MDNLEPRLLRDRKLAPDGHWLWAGQILPNGYGVFQIGRRTFYAHRTSAHIYLGLDLNNRLQQACHKRECLRRDCFNPDHLYVGNAKSNMQDKVAMGRCVNPRSRWTHCQKGHEFTAANTYTWTAKDGQTRRDCRECNREKDRNRYQLERVAHALLVA